MAMLQLQRLQVCTDGERVSHWLAVERGTLIVVKFFLPLEYMQSSCQVHLLANKETDIECASYIQPYIYIWVSAARAGRYPRNMRIIIIMQSFLCRPEVYPEISNYSQLPSLGLYTGKEASLSLRNYFSLVYRHVMHPCSDLSDIENTTISSFFP